MKITLLVDNYIIGHKGMVAEHGFSALIKLPQKGTTILFDTGTTGTVLMNNLREAKIRSEEIDLVIISHRHYDHTGGLKAFLEARNNKDTIIISHPDLFEPAYAREKSDKLRYIGNPFRKEELESLGARFVYTRKPARIMDGVIVTGEIPREWGPSHTSHMLRQGEEGLVEDSLPDDSALILETPDGLVVITGCGHAGVENIVEYATSITGEKKVAGIIGGLHLMGAEDKRIREVVKYLLSKEPAMIAPTHCTGLRAQAALATAFGKRYAVAGVGTVFTFE